MIPIEHNPTTSTDVSPNTERFFDDRATVGALLAGEMRWNCNQGNIMQEGIALDPLEEDAPSCIMDRFGKLAVFDHIADLKVFIGNQVARRDVRVCHLSGKILTLPLNFQMLLGQAFLGFLSVRRLLLFAGESSLETFEFVFRFSIVSGVLDCVAFRVGEIGFQPNINTKFPACWNMLDFALGIDAELAIVAVCPSNNANTFDLLDRKFLDALIWVANEFQATNPTAISEDDVATIGVSLPARGFVLHTPVVALETGISFLSGFLVLAIVIEPGDGKPRTGSTGLASHGVETRGERVFFGKYSTIGLQVILRGPFVVHLQAQALVANELGGPNSLFDGGILSLAPIQLVLVDQHVCLLLSRIYLYHITHVNIRIFIIQERTVNIFSCRKVFPCAQAPKKVGQFIPWINHRGFLGRGSVRYS